MHYTTPDRKWFRIALAVLALGTMPPGVLAQSAPGWRAGVASAVITPRETLWMAGYAARNKPSEGVAQDLFAKALALEDGQGGRLVIVTMDLIGIPRIMRDQVAKEVEAKHRLPPHALLLNASHTHCGPVVRSGGSAIYDLDAEMSERI